MICPSICLNIMTKMRPYLNGKTTKDDYERRRKSMTVQSPNVTVQNPNDPIYSESLQNPNQP